MFKKIRYFVSYVFSRERSWGFSNCEISRDDPILGMGDIRQVADEIERETGKRDVVVLNYQKFVR